MTEGFIYSITLKGQGKPVYIGQTRQRPQTRWRQHIISGKSRVSRALQFLGGPDDFEFTVIDTVPVRELNAREAFWIEQYGTFHPDGLNMTKGGASAYSEASRSRMSAAAKLRCADPEWRASWSQRWKDPAYREKMLAKREDSPGFGRFSKHSAETKAKMSDAQRRRVISPELQESYRQGAIAANAKRRAKKAGVFG